MTHRRGFTLIELLVVISIVAIMVSLLLPAISRARMVTLQVLCAGQLRQVGIATEVYLVENKHWIERLYPGNAWPDDVSVCPTFGKGRTSGVVANYRSPLLHNVYAGGAYMEKRRDGDYVRLVEGLAHRDANGDPYENVYSGKSYDPLETFPIAADELRQSKHAASRTLAPHNGGDPGANWMGSPFIDSEGANSAWLDGSVEWHEWPIDARFRRKAQDSPDVNFYPRNLAAGAVGPDDMWTARGNDFARYFFWGRAKPRDP